MPYKPCPDLKIRLVEHREPGSCGQQAFSVAEGTCLRDGMDCPGHCESFPKAPSPKWKPEKWTDVDEEFEQTLQGLWPDERRRRKYEDGV